MSHISTEIAILKPTEGTAAHARPFCEFVAEGTASGSVNVHRTQGRQMLVECKLDELGMRGLQRRLGGITTQEWHAGLKYRAHWRVAVHGARVTAGYGTASGCCGVAQETPRELAANAELKKAHAALGLILSAVVASVAGLDEDVAGRGEALRSGLAVLAALWGVPEHGYSREWERR